MKTLIISVDFPLPEDKGNRMRTMHFVRFFKKYGDVDLMCYKSHAPSRQNASPFRNQYYIEMDPFNDLNKSNIFTSIHDKIVKSKPWIVNNFTAKTVEYIHDVIMTQDYDIILCRYSVNAYPLLSLPLAYKKRVILDIDDLMTGELYDVINGTKTGLTRIKAAVDKMVFHKYQMKCLELGKVLFCSETDRSKMSKYAQSDNMFVVPNIIPAGTIPDGYQRDGYGNGYLLFVGALSYQPNEMGILWFIREVFEKLPEQYRDLRLLVVGKAPRDVLKKACAANPRIEMVENPPDVVPYFEKCRAVIVPVLAGGGTRIKILEAGNCSRPVITTSLGAHGLGLEGFRDVLYFEDAASFVSAWTWLGDAGNYREMVHNLSEIVDQNYTVTNFESTLRDCCEIKQAIGAQAPLALAGG